MMIKLNSLLFFSMILVISTHAQKWNNIPPTPATLPNEASGKIITTPQGTKLWYTIQNPKSTGLPILLLHGGLGNSRYYANLIPLIKGDRPIITMDTRGHGHSPYTDNMKFGFDLYAQDFTELLKSLNIQQAAVVGWSHMAVGTITALMQPSLSKQIARAFLFGGYHNVAANNPTYNTTQTYQQFIKRVPTEFAQLQPQASFKNFASAVATLDSTSPTYTDQDISKITLGPQVTVAFGDHEEAITKAEVKALPQLIKGSKSVIIKGVSHFGILQDPKPVADAINSFLDAP